MPKTLLLADDSVTIQKVVGISFASEDIEITTVDNGRDAVAKARTLRPDIILADVVMPGMSGYEVCQAIKADPNLRHVPVLLLTGTFESFDEARAAAVGAAGHVAKPFEAQTLVDRVKQLLAAAPAARTPAAPPAVSARSAPAPPGADDDAFDFFSDAPDEVATATAAPPIARDALDLDEPDAAFAFGDDDLAAHVQEPLRAPPLAPSHRRPDATIATLPEPPASEPAEGDAFDFSFERGGADALDEPIDPDQLGHSTLLDPAAASGFDVSSSDLAAEFSSGSAATQILSAPLDADLDLTEPEPFDEPAPVARLSRDPVMDLLAREPIGEAPLEVGEPIAAHDDFEDRVRPFGAEPDPGDTIPRGSAAVELATPLWSQAAARAPIDEPFEAPPFDSGDLAEPLDSAPVAEPTQPAAPRAGPVLSPALRGELHDTLEKIAWDAFGQVTEKVVREAIARIEQVAWEVVPKLAETLIQEEIRRLKGGSGE